MNTPTKFCCVDGIVTCCRINPVGKENENQLLIGIDPNNVTRKTRVSERSGRHLLGHINAAGTFRIGLVPAECPVTAITKRLGKIGHRHWLKNPFIAIHPFLKVHLQKRSNVMRISKKARMARNPSLHGSHLIMNGTDQKLIPIVCVLFSWRTFRVRKPLQRCKAELMEAKRFIYVVRNKFIQGLLANSLYYFL